MHACQLQEKTNLPYVLKISEMTLSISAPSFTRKLHVLHFSALN